MHRNIALLITCAQLCLATSIASAATNPTLPKDYKKWAKSRQKIVNDKKSIFYGIHYIYVNKQAMPVYKNGGIYPVKSSFIVEFYNIKDNNGTISEGKKNMIVLMSKDSAQKLTGGWLFAGFSAEGKFNKTLDPVKNCFECHVKDASSKDFIISNFTDFNK